MVIVCVAVDVEGGGAGLVTTDVGMDGFSAELVDDCRCVQTRTKAAKATPTAAAATHIALDTCLSAEDGGGDDGAGVPGWSRCSLWGSSRTGVAACTVGPADVHSVSGQASRVARARAKSVQRGYR